MTTDTSPCREAMKTPEKWYEEIFQTREYFAKEHKMAWCKIFSDIQKDAWKAAQSNAPSVPDDVANAIKYFTDEDFRKEKDGEFDYINHDEMLKILVQAASKPQVDALSLQTEGSHALLMQ